MAFPRIVSRELLDHLAPQDARAVRARRDLRRINRIMGAARWMVRGMAAAAHRGAGEAPMRVLELGAGDCSLMLRIARRMSRSWPAVELTLLDRQALIDSRTRAAFARLGWCALPATADVLAWAAEPADAVRWDVIAANLFLHHFAPPQLEALLAAVAGRCDVFVACEPRRSLPALVGSHLVGVVGASSVTRCDAVLSVHAGFRDAELGALWPGSRAEWRLQERAAGLFSHFFCAVRRGNGAAEAA